MMKKLFIYLVSQYTILRSLHDEFGSNDQNIIMKTLNKSKVFINIYFLVSFNYFQRNKYKKNDLLKKSYCIVKFYLIDFENIS